MRNRRKPETANHACSWCGKGKRLSSRLNGAVFRLPPKWVIVTMRHSILEFACSWKCAKHLRRHLEKSQQE